MNIVLPEKYSDIPIIGFGGYFGKGVPAPFEIIPNEEARKALCENAFEWSYTNSAAFIEYSEVQYLRFRLHINKYIKEIENAGLGGIILAKYEEGEATKYNVYVLTCYVTCDEGNEVFYSKEGKLYYRENNVLVENFVYEDFDIEKHNEETKEWPFITAPFAIT